MNKADTSRRALGKGLGALLPTRPTAAPGSAEPPHDDSPRAVPIDSIDPNPLQPRRVFQGERLAELAQSIRTNGIIQPLVVRRVGDRYQLVAGERRWRAAKLAGVSQVPVVVRDIPDDRLLEITLIENIQREDLNPIETATAFERLGRELSLSAEEIGSRPAKTAPPSPTSSVSCSFPRTSSNWSAERRLSAGHARCLLSLAVTRFAAGSRRESRGARVVRTPDWSAPPRR